MDVQWVTFGSFPFHLVHLIAGALDAAGVPNHVVQPEIGYGLDVGSFAHRVLVPSEHLDDAREVLNQLNQGHVQITAPEEWGELEA